MREARVEKRANAQSSMIWFLQMAQLSTRMSHAQIETADHCEETIRQQKGKLPNGFVVGELLSHLPRVCSLHLTFAFLQARHEGTTERTFLTSNFFPLPLPSLAPPFLTGPFLTGFLTAPSSGAGTLAAAAAEVDASGSTSMADMVQSGGKESWLGTG